MSDCWPRLLPSGDCGLLVEFAPEVSPDTTALVLGADAALVRLPGVVETIPALRSLLLVYDPLAVEFDRLVEHAEAALRRVRPAPLEAGRLVEVPVAYGGEHGADLEEVARACDLDPAEVIQFHSGSTYLVMMLGFAPGFPYLGPLSDRLRMPRRATPRTRVPAGSVAIADRFTGIYPHTTAGGWHLLGRTTLRLFDPDRSPPCLLHPGDRVRFLPAERLALSMMDDRPVASVERPRTPAFEVLEPGLLTTIQDLGRPGWRRFGIPASGPLDRVAYLAANAAVGNPAGAAALECTFPAPRLRVLAEVRVAVAGADFDPRLNHSAVDPLEPVVARPGDVLEFREPRGGQWAYLAVAGGIDGPVAFGSRSTYTRGGLGGLLGRSLRKGDVLGVGDVCAHSTPSRARRTVVERARGLSGPVRVILGPHLSEFTEAAQAAWVGQTFEVTVQRDRSGTRLRGPALGCRRSAEVISCPVLPGTVQVPGDGQPIVILADGPTTGGYAQIATVIGADLDDLVQVAPGARVRFEAVSVATAHEAWRTSMIAHTRSH